MASYLKSQECYPSSHLTRSIKKVNCTAQKLYLPAHPYVSIAFSILPCITPRSPGGRPEEQRGRDEERGRGGGRSVFSLRRQRSGKKYTVLLLHFSLFTLQIQCGGAAVFRLVVPCSFLNPSSPTPSMVPRFRQVSDGGLHLQGEQHKQRGDLALTDFESHTSTRTHCACMQNDFQQRSSPRKNLTKNNCQSVTQPSIRRLRAGPGRPDLTGFLGGGPHAVSAPSVARP